MPEVPFPGERQLWSGRPARPRAAATRYILTDLRVVRIDGDRMAEVALYDIGEVRCSRSRLDRCLGTTTVSVHARRGTNAVTLTGVRQGAQLAALFELLSGEPRAVLDRDGVRAALAWCPKSPTRGRREAAIGAAAVLVAICGVTMGLHGRASALVYPADDRIYPSGEKRSRAEIIEFMRTDVMPWARVTLGRLKGGPDRVTCETCHGRGAEAVGWRMPAVAVLPAPALRESGWEQNGGPMDAQVRNAIYGYRAEHENQARAAYMREVVLPGMAQLLHRPAYDFTKPYEFNRARLAFGCYHCHKIK